MNQQLVLNIIKFNHPVEIKDFSFYKESGEGRYPIDKDELPVNIEEIYPVANLKFLYTDFVSSKGAKTVSVNLRHSKRFAKHYYSWLIGRYFKSIADISHPNFVKDIELWFHDKKASNLSFKVFRKFILRVQIGRITDFPEMVVSYEGTSKVLNKSLWDEDYNPEKLKTVIYQKQIFSYKHLSNEALQNLKDVFPVLNPSLRRSIGLQVEFVKIENKIKNYFDQINWFYKTYLNTDEFMALIPHDSEGFTNIGVQRIKNTTYGSNALIFGNGKLDINPMNGLKYNGPYKPTDHKIIKFIFIYYEEDKDSAIELYKYFLGSLNKPDENGKYKKFKGLRRFINLQYTVNKEDHLVFKNKENPLPEIREQIQNKSYTPDAHYVGIYISPYNKDCENLTYKKIYYQVKEELLKHGITSQVVEKETVWMEDFFFSMPNIAVAILAKLEGIPWRLKRTVINELVVGVGAFKAKSINARYVGSAFCFSNDGHFQGFNCYPANDTIMLAGSIRDAVQTFYKKNNKVERLIIHFYKRLSKKELAPILEKLNNLGLKVPVIIITINKTESKDYVVFDLACDKLIPDSGTFIDIDRNQYLLCNNTRYGDRMPNKIEGYPLPVKLTIKASPESYALSDEILTDLIDQVYQFSRMYWKSVSQQNLPVTIKYPEMVAEIFPHFDSNIIPPFGQNNLWFL